MQGIRPVSGKSVRCFEAIVFVCLLAALAAPLAAPLAAAAQQPMVHLTGKVIDQAGRPVAGVVVTLRETASKATVQATTNAAGAFDLPAEAGHDADLQAHNAGLIAEAGIAAASLARPLELVLRPPSAAGGVPAMEFSDEPHFTVAGVTDWTAVGGHGSDSTLRTSESLAATSASLPGEPAGAGTAREAQLQRELREATPADENRVREHIHAALRDRPTATLYRLAAEADERNGQPLAAVREFEQAASLEPSEANEFAWGSELLVHRAILQAEAVFQHAAALYPASVRMQTALGTALFAGARYEEAAERLCRAADLAPNEPAAYGFLAKVDQAAPHALACIEPRLARYQQLAPRSAEARYWYAMAILKRHAGAPDSTEAHHAETLPETLLQQAIALDPHCAPAYLELGILAAQREDLPGAIRYDAQAIQADPALDDAYYRLANAYARTGNTEQAKAAFAMHETLKQAQAQAVEQQRKAVKQFSFAHAGDAPTGATP